jgi:hypothetical protein
MGYPWAWKSQLVIKHSEMLIKVLLYDAVSIVEITSWKENSIFLQKRTLDVTVHIIIGVWASDPKKRDSILGYEGKSSKLKLGTCTTQQNVTAMLVLKAVQQIGELYLSLSRDWLSCMKRPYGGQPMSIGHTWFVTPFKYKCTVTSGRAELQQCRKG